MVTTNGIGTITVATIIKWGEIVKGVVEWIRFDNKILRWCSNLPENEFALQQAFTQNLQNNKGRAKTKFRNDYDFEEANKEFENMCLNSDKEKVGEEASAVQVVYDFFLIFFLLLFFLSTFFRHYHRILKIPIFDHLTSSFLT